MLRKLLIVALAAPLAQAALAHDKETTSPFDPTVQDLTLERGGPPMLGIHWAREHAASHAARHGSSPLMTFHGGKIMMTAVTQAIFWGPSWTTDTSDKIPGLESWYEGHGDSNYAKTVDEYTGTNGQVGSATSHLSYLRDGSKAAGGGSTSAILAEVCKMVPSPDPSGNGYYAVYSEVKRGGAQYLSLIHISEPTRH